MKKTLILSQDELKERIQDLGAQISIDYKDRDLVAIGVLNGAFIFMADLVRAISIPLAADFIRVASYDNNSSSGTISLTKDVELDIAGKDVLLVEDIVDTGNTMTWLHNYFKDRSVRSLKTCALLNKLERREIDVTIDYAGFADKGGFLVGYGLDYAQLYRNLPEIYALEL
jgi:hypoxanthine phosphoribosyltransferase